MLKFKRINNGGLMEMEEGLRNGTTFKKLQDLAIHLKNFTTMQEILWFQVWILMIKTQLIIRWESTMLKLKKKNSGGLMEMEVDQKNGIIFKSLEDLVKMLMIFIDKQDILWFQVWILMIKIQFITIWESKMHS